MRDFGTSAYIAGTAARKLDAPHRQEARIIAFPGNRTMDKGSRVSDERFPAKVDAGVEQPSVTISSDVLYGLLRGTAAGQASGRMTPTQTAGVICLFAAIAFGSLLLGF